MPSLIGNFLVIGPIVFWAMQGMTNGLFWSAFQTVQFVVPLTLALSFFDTLAGLLAQAKLTQAQGCFVAFAVIFFGGWVGIRQAGVALLPEEGIRTYKIVDRLGGVAMGALAGTVFAGGLLIAWSMVPLSAQLKIDVGQLKFDAGAKVIEQFGALARVVGDPDKAFAVTGEPAAAEDATEFEVGQEPYTDKNADEQRSEDEPYVDVDGNNKWTEVLRYVDVNGNGQRDMGVMEMYRTGLWSGPKAAALADKEKGA